MRVASTRNLIADIPFEHGFNDFDGDDIKIDVINTIRTWPLHCWHPIQAYCERDQPQIHCRREPTQTLRSSPGHVVDVLVIYEDGVVHDGIRCRQEPTQNLLLSPGPR